MIRIIAFVVAVIVVAAVATWISEPPGRVEIAWGDYMVESSPGVLAAAIAVAAAVVLVIAAVVRFVWIGPAASRWRAVAAASVWAIGR